MLEFVNRHGVEFMLLNYIYNSAVQAMPAIDEHCGKLYQFTYRFAHGLAGNWRLVARSHAEATAALAPAAVPVVLTDRLASPQ